MKLTAEQVQNDLNALPRNAKTADVDRLIRRYGKEKADVSALRPYILEQQQLHRIYYYVSLNQIQDVNARMAFIDDNLLFSDWWHTDQLIHYVAQLDFDTAMRYARDYTRRDDPFVRRWGYVLFISKLCRGHARELFSLLHNDEHYTVQMAQAWLIAELAVFEPNTVLAWMAHNGLNYAVNGKAIQKICDSYRIDTDVKARFKQLRPALKQNT